MNPNYISICSGSLDPFVVEQRLAHLLPVWQTLDLAECERLQDGRAKVGPIGTSAEQMGNIKAIWPSKLRVAGQIPSFDLPEAELSFDTVEHLIRSVEQTIVDKHFPAVLAYWSSKRASRLVPTGKRIVELWQTAYSISVFSAGINEQPEQWCFWIESSGLCLVVQGKAVEAPA